MEVIFDKKISANILFTRLSIFCVRTQEDKCDELQKKKKALKCMRGRRRIFMRVNRQSFFGRKLEKTTKTQTRDDDKTMSRQI